jgi:hypothetical protein
MSISVTRAFKLAKDLSLPPEAAVWVISYVAKRNAGKTYDASVQAEEMLKAGIPIIVIDGMGVWWGLRVAKDGKSDGLPVVVFGGDHADLPLVLDKAEQMARAIVESNVSVVLDLSGVSKTQSRRFLPVFLDKLFQLNRAVRHVFIEEADMYAPQKPIGPEQNICQSAVDNFVRRGGNRNLGVTMLTQRSAVLSKDVLTQSDCLVVLRTVAPQDKKAIQEWVKRHSEEDPKKLAKWYDTLDSLENGQAYVWHPEPPKIFAKTKFRPRETLHATREFLLEPGKVKLMNVNEFVERFRAVFEPRPKPRFESVDMSKPPPRKVKLPPGSKSIAEEVHEIRKEQHIREIRDALPEFGFLSVSPVAQRALRKGDAVAKPTEAATLNSEVGPSISPQHVQHSLPAYRALDPRDDGPPTTLRQSLPDLRIEQFKPTLNLTAEILNHPTDMLTKVAVILKNNANAGRRNDQWTVKGIDEALRNHVWEEDQATLKGAVNQLLRWEILVWASHYLRFDPKRVQIVEREVVSAE